MATIARFFPLFPPRSPVSVPSAPEITVDPKWPQNVLRPLHQQGSQIGIAFLADVHLGLALAEVSPSWLQSQINNPRRGSCQNDVGLSA